MAKKRKRRDRPHRMRGNMHWTEQTTDGLVLAVIIVVGLLIVREFYERQFRRYDVNRTPRKRKKP
jgi:hypothetical protein